MLFLLLIDSSFFSKTILIFSVYNLINNILDIFFDELLFLLLYKFTKKN